MQRAQTPFLRMPIGNVLRISGSTLHLNFDPIGSSQFEVPLDDRAGEVVHLLEGFAFPIVEVSLPMPRRVSSRTGSAENKELRIWRPLHFLNVTPMLAIRDLKSLVARTVPFIL